MSTGVPNRLTACRAAKCWLLLARLTPPAVRHPSCFFLSPPAHHPLGGGGRWNQSNGIARCTALGEPDLPGLINGQSKGPAVGGRNRVERKRSGGWMHRSNGIAPNVGKPHGASGPWCQPIDPSRRGSRPQGWYPIRVDRAGGRIELVEGPVEVRCTPDGPI